MGLPVRFAAPDPQRQGRGGVSRMCVAGNLGVNKSNTEGGKPRFA